MVLKVEAVTFDDFYTLRYPIGEKEDVIYPILRALKKQGLDVDEKNFLKQYFEADRLYRKRLEETLRESLLDDVIMNALPACCYEPKKERTIVKEAVDLGLATRKARWFPNAKWTLLTLRKKGYKLALISNTHWRLSERVR